MQDLLRQTDSRERQKQDQLVNTVSHTLALSVVNNLERNVKNEFKNTVAPGKFIFCVNHIKRHSVNMLITLS